MRELMSGLWTALVGSAQRSSISCLANSVFEAFTIPLARTIFNNYVVALNHGSNSDRNRLEMEFGQPPALKKEFRILDPIQGLPLILLGRLARPVSW